VTLSRFAFIFSAAACIALYSPGNDHYRLAAIGFVVLAILSDILDGRIARWLGQESYLGGVLDAAADAIGFTVGFILLSVFDVGMRFPLWLVLIVVGREMAVYGLFLAVTLKKGRVNKKPSRLSRWNTSLLALCVLLLLCRIEDSWLLWPVSSVTTLATGADNIMAAIKALRE